MKKQDVIWIDGFYYTKREYNRYFPQGHGNRTAIPDSIYVESFSEKLSRGIKKALYYVILVLLFAALFYVIYCMGHDALLHRL